MKGDKRWPNTFTEVEDLGGGKFGASVTVGHRVFFDKADSNKPNKHKLTDERVLLSSRPSAVLKSIPTMPNTLMCSMKKSGSMRRDG